MWYPILLILWHHPLFCLTVVSHWFLILVLLWHHIKYLQLFYCYVIVTQSGVFDRVVRILHHQRNKGNLQCTAFHVDENLNINGWTKLRPVSIPSVKHTEKLTRRKQYIVRSIIWNLSSTHLTVYCILHVAHHVSHLYDNVSYFFTGLLYS